MPYGLHRRKFVRTFNTVRPWIYSLVLSAAINVPARAQSLLRFRHIDSSRSARTLLTVTNPTGHFADIQYTLYAADGGIATNHPLHPARYRISPHGTLSLFSDQIFDAEVSGSIEVSSSVSGLIGRSANSPPELGGVAPRGAGVVPARNTPAGERFRLTSLGPPSNSGGESASGPNDTLWRTVVGRAFYEKIDLTDSGLDLNHPVIVPIRNARVEVLNPATNSVVWVSQTDDVGRFVVLAPAQLKSRVRVLSRLRESKVLVEDNRNGNSLYAAASDLNPQDTGLFILARDSARLSGAFNILEMLQEGREMVRFADPAAIPPDVTALWSPLNSPSPDGGKEAVGSTYFDSKTNTISFVGDRSVDSDEFDDSVILHEYGHLVAAAFSRDSSPGGIHVLGDALDPRVAWSEGWANFFSGVVRNVPFYRDSYGPNGAQVLRYDLRDDTPQGDQPGYWSEFSVHSILWDLFGSASDDSDSLEKPIQTIWQAFKDLRQDHFVYLPYFLEHLLVRNPDLSDAISAIVRARSIDFHPDTRPSVANPFPQSIDIGAVTTGIVDSLSTQRKDLLRSSGFLMFQTSGGPTSIRMDITGLGPGNNPNANDLDLFLYDQDGKLIALSDKGLNGQSQLIPVVLLAGSYVLEVRSYYERADTKKTVYNSGTYQLIVRSITN